MGWSSNSLQENVHSNAGVTIFFLSLHFSLGSCRGPLRKEGSVAYSPWPFVLSMSHRLANIGVGVGRGAICSPGEWESHTYKFRWPFLFLSHCFFMHGLRQVSTNCFSLQQPGPMQGPPKILRDIFNLTADHISDLYSSLWWRCIPPTFLPSSQFQGLKKHLGFSTVPWVPTLIGGMIFASFQHSSPLWFQTPGCWKYCKPSWFQSRQWAIHFPFLKNPKNSIRVGKG